MKTLLKIYSLSCVIVLSFFGFFMIPWGVLPFSDAVNMMVVGAVIVSLTGFYTLYIHRREGLELGWFLANRGGFWVITVAVLGFALLLCGMLFFISPEVFVPAFEQGALPFGVGLVSLFWLALIFMFAFLTLGMLAKATACVRMFRFTEAFIDTLITLVCLGLAAVFFSLFLEVINDIAIRISVANQWRAIWIFVVLLVVAGVVYGFWNEPSYYLDENKVDNAAKERQ